MATIGLARLPKSPGAYGGYATNRQEDSPTGDEPMPTGGNSPTASPAQPSNPFQPYAPTSTPTASPAQPSQPWRPGPGASPANPFNIAQWGQGWTSSGGKTLQDWLTYWTQHPEASQAGYTLSGSKQDKVLAPGGLSGWDAVIGSGIGGQGASWNQFGSGANGVFSDPATSQWEQMLRALSGQLNQPINTADYQPLVDYLRKYFQELQGPAYTPGQSDLIQTQAIDPMTKQRDVAKQQALTRLAARGIAPSSGIAQQALSDIDRSYEQQVTGVHGKFAENAINVEKQQHQMAGGVGNALNQLERAQTVGDEQRAMQALSLMFQIPQLADQRMAQAQSTIQPLNPSALFGNQYQFGQQGLQQYGNTQDFYSQLMQMLVRAFGQQPSY